MAEPVAIGTDADEAVRLQEVPSDRTHTLTHSIEITQSHPTQLLCNSLTSRSHSRPHAQGVRVVVRVRPFLAREADHTKEKLSYDATGKVWTHKHISIHQK